MNLFANNSAFIYLVPALALMAAAWYGGALRKRKTEAALFDKQILRELKKHISGTAAKIKNICFISAVIFIFIAMAAPQWGTEAAQISESASYMVIAVDVSASMKAQDLKPNRLENAKTMIKILTETLKGVRKGIVAFTSEAYVQCPVTADDNALKYFVNALRPDMLPAKGTSLGKAVETSVKLLSGYSGKKALVLLTDGEDHDPEEIDAAARTARENNVKIIAVGIGSKEGELIPEFTPGANVKDYKKDKDGNPVVTKLQEEPLITLAKETGGMYIQYKNFQTAASAIQNAVEDLDKEQRAPGSKNIYKNRYRIPLSFALLLLLASMLIPVNKKEE